MSEHEDSAAGADMPPVVGAPAYAAAAAVVVVATGIAMPMFLEPASLIMAYLIAVMFIAARYGRRVSVFATFCAP